MPTDDRLDRAIDVVRRLDALQAERAKLDAQIAAAKKDFARLVGGGEPPPSAEELFGKDDDDSTSGTERGPDGRTLADRALEIIRSNRDVTYAKLAKALYGSDDEPSRNRARSVIYFLRQRRLITKTESGWIATPEEP